jgi:hypothetical protein
MGLTEVVSLEAEVTYSLGKYNKKTGKTDPKSVEGYYLGKRVVETKLGDSSIHFFQTEKGPVGVWGTKYLNSKLSNVKPGTMTKAEFVGMKPTPRGDMRSFKVFQDKENTIEVSVEPPVAQYADEFAAVSDNRATYNEDDKNEDDKDEDNNSGYEAPSYAAATVNNTQVSAAERQARVQALLNKGKKK